MSTGITLTDENFATEVIESDLPVLIDFWAEWCMPCKMIGPIIDQLAGEYAGKIKIGKVNIDEEGDLAAKHNVISIPTLIVYKNGNIVRQKAGAVPKHEIENLFKDLL
ncbi:thioredoxin [Breznakiella homolactica]|uniref:Thioredoxin n=1 Tax=Breznakiella homolactica TaxID=2798577 RepID=A0A7T7XNF5_9SPIR|nr:thioredoxin [Breznakiella homolactica]QQO09556.1 thioredoxin [Breznakiella homolactica]